MTYSFSKLLNTHCVLGTHCVLMSRPGAPWFPTHHTANTWLRPCYDRNCLYRNQALLLVIGASINPEFSRFFQLLALPDGASLVNLQIPWPSFRRLSPLWLYSHS